MVRVNDETREGESIEEGRKLVEKELGHGHLLQEEVQPSQASLKYYQDSMTMVKNTSSDKAGLGLTVREVQVRLSSGPSSCLKMLEIFLVFLEEKISKEK